MKVCPTNAVQPTLFEAGLEGLWSPVLKMKLGYCEYECTLCTQVCPTEAITGEVKQAHQIVQDKCISYGSCFDACTRDAIRFFPKREQTTTSERKAS